MRILNIFALFLFVQLLGARSGPCWAMPLAGTSENPLSVHIVPVPLMVDKTGQNVYIVGEPENKLDSYLPAVAFDIEAVAYAPAPQDNGKEFLPFDESKVMEFLKAFHVVVGQDNGKEWKEGQLRQKVLFSQYDPKRFCARIRVDLTDGWPMGRMLVNAGFDVNEVKRQMNVSIRLPPESQTIQIRFDVRAKQAQDEQLRKRFDVSTHFRPSICQPPHLRSTSEDIDALLRAFPDDVWGHAYAGFVADQGLGGYDYESNRYKMVYQNGLSVPEPSLLPRLETARRHYKFVLQRMAKALYPKGILYLDSLDKPVILTPEYKELGFDNWRGMTGPLELMEYFNRNLAGIESREEILKSGMLLSEQEIIDAQAVIKILASDTEMAKSLRKELEYKMSESDPLRLRIENTQQEAQKGEVAFALNMLIKGRPLDDLSKLPSVKMSPETLQVLARKPVVFTGYSDYYKWARQFNRRLLEDIFSPHVTRLIQKTAVT